MIYVTIATYVYVYYMYQYGVTNKVDDPLPDPPDLLGFFFFFRAVNHMILFCLCLQEHRQGTQIQDCKLFCEF